MSAFYNKLIMALMSIKVDKYAHILISIIIAGTLMHILPMPIWANALTSMVVTISIGISKELIDKKSYGLFDKWDLLADSIGAAIGTLIAI